jgi:hypothetical protein
MPLSPKKRKSPLYMSDISNLPFTILASHAKPNCKEQSSSR